MSETLTFERGAVVMTLTLEGCIFDLPEEDLKLALEVRDALRSIFAVGEKMEGRKKRATAKPKRNRRPPAKEEPRPQIGDTRPAPDPRQITKHLKGEGKIRWEDQIASLFDGTCDRIVREVADQKAGNNLKYFIQNKDRRCRVDVSTVEGVTIVEVRRREGGE